jgi:hypothetical protein
VPGCQHVLGGGAPCQDAAATRVATDRVILAVSDGHGDAEYPYSDEGARIAVAVAVDALDKFVDHLAGTPRHSGDAALDHEVAAPLKRRIAFEWNRRVKHHARMVAARDDSTALWGEGVTGDWDPKVKAYGCTLLAAAFLDDLGIWLRLGDGDALAVTVSGAARRPFAAADKSMGQATYSLSMRGCVEHMQVAFEPRGGCELAVLATDGVVDQYDVDPSFEGQWGTRILERIRAKGWTEAMMELPRELGTVARDGDDCTVALAWLPKAPADTES